MGWEAQGRLGYVCFFSHITLMVKRGKVSLPVLKGVQLGVIHSFSELTLEELMNNWHSLLHAHQAPHPIVCPGNFIFLFVHLSAPTCLPLPLMWSDTVLGSVTGRGRERSGRDQIVERTKGLHSVRQLAVADWPTRHHAALHTFVK